MYAMDPVNRGGQLVLYVRWKIGPSRDMGYHRGEESRLPSILNLFTPYCPCSRVEGRDAFSPMMRTDCSDPG
jgi:hypothetical protein